MKEELNNEILNFNKSYSLEKAQNISIDSILKKEFSPKKEKEKKIGSQKILNDMKNIFDL